ncbi:NnrU family protein [Rhodoferax sp. 4810]|uniref:NnrU family protein n=1 Tax=Thiospirillum jenense TaxID=1653858 RepID=A0A839HCF6_9GAMM|nr:NnrU family protein [Thiospirillum jenense]MBB1076294.1 NnrU family protein [Rhodoferax jenense]MBB1124887.1 NnrU family protein [Thiospirillum jenense]
MSILIVGLILFLGTHSINMIRPTLRDTIIRRIGFNGWQGLYSLVALAGLIMIGTGYSDVRDSTNTLLIYESPVWMRHFSLLLLLPIFPLLFATYLPGRIQTAVQHPTLMAVKIWALAHLLANGTLADVLLFGGFLIWAVADRISIKRRTTVAPISGAPAGRWNDVIAISGGLLIYIVFLFGLHTWLIGISPLGR